MLDCTVSSATSTGVTLTIAVHENVGATASNVGRWNSDGNGPSGPVAVATARPIRNAGTIAGNRVARMRCATRYAISVAPTMTTTSTAMPASSDVSSEEKM